MKSGKAVERKLCPSDDTATASTTDTPMTDAPIAHAIKNTCLAEAELSEHEHN